MSNITLESLGLTKDEITERIITRIRAGLRLRVGGRVVARARGGGRHV